MTIYHYTNLRGFKGIGSSATWRFRAGKPPGPHPFGAYFTDLSPDTKNLALRLRIPRTKVEYMFSFTDAGDLTPIRGERGRHVFFSIRDYAVDPDRQVEHGRTGL